MEYERFAWKMPTMEEVRLKVQALHAFRKRLPEGAVGGISISVRGDDVNIAYAVQREEEAKK